MADLTKLKAIVGPDSGLHSWREVMQLTEEQAEKGAIRRADIAPPPKGGNLDAPVVLAPMVPARFAEASFETFESATPVQRTARKAAERFVEYALSGKPVMLALIGAQGTGKSHLLYAAARAVAASGRKLYSRPWYVLADELRYGGASPFNGQRLESHEVRALLWSQRVVFVDEVRPTSGTEFDDTELAKFACHAYDAGLAVLITTNVAPLERVMGPAAASRFTQITVTGEDRRQVGQPPSKPKRVA